MVVLVVLFSLQAVALLPAAAAAQA